MHLVKMWFVTRLDPMFQLLKKSNQMLWSVSTEKKNEIQSSYMSAVQGIDTRVSPGVGVTTLPFVNFSIIKVFDLANVTVMFLESYSYLTVATTAELWWHLSNINVIFKIQSVFWQYFICGLYSKFMLSRERQMSHTDACYLHVLGSQTRPNWV